VIGPAFRALACFALCTLVTVAAPAAESVRYAREGSSLTVQFGWSERGLQASVADVGPLWTFDPASREFQRGAGLPVTGAASCRADGLPAGVTPMRVLQFDRNADARIEPASGDFARLFFGAMPAGAQETSVAQPRYFALDISDPFAPLVLWIDTPRELPGLGMPVSAPAIARIDIAPARNRDNEKFVLLFGAGKTAMATAALRLFAVDARSGALLWSAGNAAGANLRLAALRSDMTGGVAAIDVDGDGFAERLYAGDDAGVLWRFDLRNGSSAAALASAGALARVPGALRGMPDVALIQPGNAAPYFNIAIATVSAASTSEELRHGGWLYALRDPRPFEQLSQREFDRLRPIDAAELVLAGGADRRPDEHGWRLALAPGEWLPDATLTADGRLLFTSFRRGSAAAGCEPQGNNRVYALSIEDARAALDLDGNGSIDARDRSRELVQREPVRGVALVIARDAAGAAETAVCTAGGERLPACLRAATTRRTYWYRSDAD
jgi:hypothetical protein